MAKLSKVTKQPNNMLFGLFISISSNHFRLSTLQHGHQCTLHFRLKKIDYNAQVADRI